MKDEIIVATTNAHKLREIKQVLKGYRVKGQGSRVKENGKTFEENALKKARSIKLKPGQIAIADDSGLMVNALDGNPGVRSARFACPPTTDNLCGKLLQVMEIGNRGKGLGVKSREAKFVCAIAVKFPNGNIRTVKGICRGKIIHEMRGKNGFGYDPVFVPNGYKKTFAEMAPALKNRISHRGKALKKLSAKLRRISK